MGISDLTKKMIAYSEGNLTDIHHFMKVYAFSTIIAKGEGVDKDTLDIVEAVAILHDIACPLCRKKYSCVDGKYQELEGPALIRDFLKDSDYSQEFIERIAYLVGHHHTLTDIDGIDYQILIEADYFVNSHEMNLDIENIRNMYNKVFRTTTGRKLLSDMYGL